MKWMFSFLFLFIISSGLIAQPAAKADVIIKMNGEEMSGKVVEITDSEIKFTYTGETLIYPIKKIDILKITYASGRTEIFNKTLPSEAKSTAASGPQLSKEDHNNRVAVLPFAYVRDGQTTNDVMSEKVQSECYAILSQHAGKYTILEPRTTNALLIKSGITKDNIKGYTMNDLCDVLGVEFIIDGLVSVNAASQSITQTDNRSTTTKNNDKSSNKEKNSSGTSYATASQDFETSLNLIIYNDKGSSVYNQQKKSLLSSQEAYKSTLSYLLKRTPLYSK